MNVKSAFIRSLVALAAAVPASHVVGEATATAAPQSAVAQPKESVKFAANITDKLNGVRPIAAHIFEEVWAESTFTEIQPPLAPTPPTAALSPLDAFDYVNRLA